MLPQFQFGIGSGYGGGQGRGSMMSWQNMPMMLANMMGAGMMPAAGKAAQAPLQSSSSGGQYGSSLYSGRTGN